MSQYWLGGLRSTRPREYEKVSETHDLGRNLTPMLAGGKICILARKSGFPRNSSSTFHHFLNVFPQISATRHWETTLWILRNFIFLRFRCACKANFRVPLCYNFLESEDLEPEIRLSSCTSIGKEGSEAQVQRT